jgi:hypothetical protein
LGGQAIRTTFGHPIRISSGYRCLAVDAAVGSTDRSQHLLGQAADPAGASAVPAIMRARTNPSREAIQNGAARPSKLFLSYAHSNEARIREIGQWGSWRALRQVAREIGAPDPGDCPSTRKPAARRAARGKRKKR